jgi:RHS repeat-associated protein
LYDSGGNRTTAGYSTGAGNELSASPGYTYTYDNEGNLTGKTQTSGGTSVTTYSYDYRDRLTGVTVRASSGGAVTSQATYTYDPEGRRIGVDANGTQTWAVYDGQNTYADYDGSGALQVRYLYGPAVDDLLARTDSGGTTAWYLTDKLGTVRDIANASGAVIDHLSYDSYGKVLSESAPASGDRFKFTGREYDAATGLYYYRARYYDPAAGRFISRDPKGFDAGDVNLYRYVGNGPANGSDPSGLDQQAAPPSGGGPTIADVIGNYQTSNDIMQRKSFLNPIDQDRVPPVFPKQFGGNGTGPSPATSPVRIPPGFVRSQAPGWWINTKAPRKAGYNPQLIPGTSNPQQPVRGGVRGPSWITPLDPVGPPRPVPRGSSPATTPF